GREVHLTLDGERIVSATGLLAVRAVDQHFRVLADVAAQLPDPRSPRYVTHSAEALLTQAVYQILAGYPDLHDADATRDDPLFQILADLAPDPERPLASGSTLARFQYAFTRRDAELPPEERPGPAHASCGAADVLAEIVAALRAAWPGVAITVRGDSGLAVPAVYDFCEGQALSYVLGYASNAVLERATACAADDVELYYAFY